MSSIVIKYKGKDLKFPATLNELNKEQFLFLSHHFYLQSIGENYDEEKMSAFRLVLLKKFTGLSWARFSQLTKDEIADLMSYTDFVFQEFNLDVLLLPGFWHGWKYYKGPDEHFDTVTFSELASADTYFIKFSADKDEKWLDKLVATLYRPHLGTKKRNKFNELDLEKNALNLCTLPIQTKAAVYYTWYAFRKNIMIATFKNLFPESTETEATATAKKVGNDYGWSGVINDMSGIKFGPINETKDQLWMDVFTHMSQEKDRENQLKTKD